MDYTRDDIYYCPGCGQFFDQLTDKLVDVSFEEMPLPFAAMVRRDRKNSSRECHLSKIRKSPKKKTSTGFAK